MARLSNVSLIIYGQPARYKLAKAGTQGKLAGIALRQALLEIGSCVNLGSITKYRKATN